MKRFLVGLFVSKKRKALLEDFAKLVLEIPKVNSVEECMEGYKKSTSSIKDSAIMRKTLFFGTIYTDSLITSWIPKLISRTGGTNPHIMDGRPLMYILTLTIMLILESV